MEINLLALLVATLMPTLIGFVWYHPKLFGNVWMRGTGLSEEHLKSGNMAVILGLSLFFSLLLAWTMNLLAYHDGFVQGALFYETNGTMIPEAGSEAAKWLEHFQTHYSDSCRTFKHGAFHGVFLAGLGIALPVMAVNGLFERRGWKYIAVNAGYWLVTLGLMGGVLAGWK
jgi:hypothetical protein